jgi:hypothetical protein
LSFGSQEAQKDTMGREESWCEQVKEAFFFYSQHLNTHTHRLRRNQQREGGVVSVFEGSHEREAKEVSAMMMTMTMATTTIKVGLESLFPFFFLSIFFFSQTPLQRGSIFGRSLWMMKKPR